MRCTVIVGLAVSLLASACSVAPTATPAAPTPLARDAPTPLPTPADGGSITLGGTRMFDLAGGPLLVRYDGRAGETISVVVRALGPDADGYPLDVVVEALDAAGRRRLAYNDDHAGGPASLAATDAHLPALRVPTDGVLLLRVNSFNGVQRGPVEVRVQQADEAALAATRAALATRTATHHALTATANAQSYPLTVMALAGTPTP